MFAFAQLCLPALQFLQHPQMAPFYPLLDDKGWQQIC